MTVYTYWDGNSPVGVGMVGGREGGDDELLLCTDPARLEKLLIDHCEKSGDQKGADAFRKGLKKAACQRDIIKRLYPKHLVKMLLKYAPKNRTVIITTPWQCRQELENFYGVDLTFLTNEAPQG